MSLFFVNKVSINVKHLKKEVKLCSLNSNLPIFIPDILANGLIMRVSKPNNLLKVVACSILSVVVTLYLNGGFYSFQEPAGFAWNHHTHSSLLFHSNHTHFPPNFSFSLIVETFEEIDDDNQENETPEASVNAFAFASLPCKIAVKQVTIPSLRQLVLNRKSVLLFILYHSWKSFLA